MLSAVSQFIFGGSSLFGARDAFGSSGGLWKERSLCFDLRAPDLELNQSEQLIARFFPIEDQKGNQDELGILEVTNLRLIWICGDKKRINLSIGWRTVSLVFEQSLKDSMGTPIASLCVLSKHDTTKYEFVFNKMPTFIEETRCQEAALSILAKWREERWTRVGHLTPMYLAEPFHVVARVWHAYRRTQLFRHGRANLNHLVSFTRANEHKQTSLGLKSGELNRLPSEEVLDVYAGVQQCEPKAARSPGTLVLTNIRLIWLDDALPLRNFSIPYIRVESVKLKQNERILVHTHDYLATSNQIELRAPASGELSKRARIIFEQIQNFYQLYKCKPKFGPESCDECIEYMALLKPIDQFANNNMPFEVDYLGLKVGREEENLDHGRRETTLTHEGAKGEDEAAHDRDGSELAMLSGANICSYCSEQPIGVDQEIFYSPGMGLAFELPAKGTNLERVWNIEL